MSALKPIATATLTTLFALLPERAFAREQPPAMAPTEERSGTSARTNTDLSQSIAGRWMLGLEANVVSSSWSRYDGSHDLGASIGGPTFGNAVFGYAVTERWLISGALGLGHREGEAAYDKSTSWRIMPALSYVFDGDLARPFCGLQAIAGGFKSMSVAQTFGGGLHAGVRLGISEHLSIDPVLSAQYMNSRSRLTNDSGLSGLSGDSEPHQVYASGASASTPGCDWSPCGRGIDIKHVMHRTPCGALHANHEGTRRSLPRFRCD